jgi:hypothetical protein
MIRREDGAEITVELIEAKCIDDGGCWIWQGGHSHDAPHMRFNRKTIGVRRWIAENVLDKKVAGRYVTSSCFCKSCCNPEHIVVVGKNELQQMWSDKLNYGAQLPRRIKLQKAAQRRYGHDPELVARIIADPRPQRVIAKELGRSMDYVGNIKRGVTHIPLMTNPFAGLM